MPKFYRPHNWAKHVCTALDDGAHTLLFGIVLNPVILAQLAMKLHELLPS